MSPVPLDRLRGREAAQLRQAAAGKGLTERDRVGAGRSLPLSSAAKGEFEFPGEPPRAPWARRFPEARQAACPARQHSLQAWAHGL